MNTEKISVIVPVYNAESTIERCVMSIRNQTYKNVEIILVDDGSKDNSLELCNKIAKDSDNVFVYHKKNSGVSDARNLGIQKSNGKYIQFVDSDDYIESTMCEKLITQLKDNNADMVMCTMAIKKDGELKCQTIDEGVFTGDDIAKKLINMYKTNSVNSPCNKIYKRELINDFFDNRYSLGEDLIFNLGYLEKCNKAVFINEPLYIYDFVNENSLIHRYREDNFEIATELYKRVVGFGNKHSVSNEELTPVREVYINSIFYAFQDLYYYSNLSKKEKAEKIQSWMDHKEVIECVNNTYSVSKQQHFLCGLIKNKRYGLISAFFKVKKAVSLFKH